VKGCLVKHLHSPCTRRRVLPLLPVSLLENRWFSVLRHIHPGPHPKVQGPICFLSALWLRHQRNVGTNLWQLIHPDEQILMIKQSLPWATEDSSLLQSCLIGLLVSKHVTSWKLDVLGNFLRLTMQLAEAIALHHVHNCHIIYSPIT
jgi:hypothetical protein